MKSLHRTTADFQLLAQTPSLPQAAFIGIPGEYVKLYRGAGAPFALLLLFLAYAGAHFGRSSFVRFAGRPTYANPFVLVVSELHDAIASQLVEEFFAPFEVVQNLNNGLTSALSLTYRFRDRYERLERMTTEAGDSPVLVPTVAYDAAPKRNAVITQRLVSAVSRKTVTAAGLRHGLISLFDGNDLCQFINLRDGEIRASNIHAAVATTCTHAQFQAMSPELAPLFLISEFGASDAPTASMVFGGLRPADESILATLQGSLVDAVLAPSGEISLSPTAKQCFMRELEKATASPQLFAKKVLKCALTYCLCAQSSLIEADHILAGVAVVRYSSQLEALLRRQAFASDAIAKVIDKIFRALEHAPGGLSRTQIYRALRNHTKRADVDVALTSLERLGRVQKFAVEGRSTLVWRVRNNHSEGLE